MRNRPESEPDGQFAPITKEQQEELLQQAKEAAASGNPGRMLEALHGSFALDGLTRQIASKWQKLSRDEVDFILTEAGRSPTLRLVRFAETQLFLRGEALTLAAASIGERFRATRSDC